MSVLEVPQAEVVTETGDRFRGSVANLSTTGLFLKSAHPLRFGQRLSLRLFGVAARGEVLFVSGRPRGAVIGLRASPTALAKLEAYRGTVETVVGPVGPEDPWDDVTPAQSILTDEVTVGHVISPEAEVARTPIDLRIDPALIAAATIDDESFTDPPPTREATPFDDPASVRSVPSFSDTPPVRELPSFADTPRVRQSPSFTDTPPVPEPSSFADTPPMRASAALHVVGAYDELTEDVELPNLEADGYTVRFASSFAYQAQFSSHLNHGGLVVQGGPLPVGAQRMLSLAVPDVGTYTVSARVIFHTGGRLGFILDSFGVHRDKLAAMAAAG